jgi:hypothetical protein
MFDNIDEFSFEEVKVRAEYVLHIIFFLDVLLFTHLQGSTTTAFFRNCSGNL